MKKVIGITIAVFMLAGNLVGCGNSDITPKSRLSSAQKNHRPHSSNVCKNSDRQCAGKP